MLRSDLATLLVEHETWLVRRILHYAKEYDWTRYTSTLEEAWRQSIQGLTESLVRALERFDDVPDFGPDETEDDPLTAFGLDSARAHRERGVTLAMFLGLTKYYRQSYVDLVEDHAAELDDPRRCRLFVERSFDRIEVSFSQRWVEEASTGVQDALQRTTLSLAREKNTYLTVFESQVDPTLALAEDGCIINLNRAAAGLLSPDPVPGAAYYDPVRKQELIGVHVLEHFAWLEGALAGEAERLTVTVAGEERHYAPRITRVLDVTETLTTLVTLRDITEEVVSRRALAESEERYGALFEQTRAIMLLIDPVSGDIADANPAAVGFYGWSRETLRSMKVTDLNPLPDEVVLEELSQAASSQGAHFIFEHRLASGEVRAVEAYTGPAHVDGRDFILAVIHDIEERRREMAARKERERELTIANRELERLSLVDPLTGVANRRSFDEVLVTEWLRAARDRASLGLVILDVDHFKAYNDHYGHPEGDLCLQQVALCLGECLQRPADHLTRYGGEEFAVLLPATDGRGSVGVAERLRASIEALRLDHADSPVAPVVTVSVGVAAGVPGLHMDPSDLVTAADAALYRAKRMGRNRVLEAKTSFTPRPAPWRERKGVVSD